MRRIYLHDDECDVCFHGRRERRERIMRAVWPWVVVIAAVLTVGVIEGLLGGGPR